MLKRSLGCVGLLLQIGCPGLMAVNAAPNPNVADCSNPPGFRYAAPVDLTTNCWTNGHAQLVLRGAAPANGATVPFAVEGQELLPSALEGSLTPHAGDEANPGCTMHLSFEHLNLDCLGDVSAGAAIPCTKAGASEKVCEVKVKVQEAWKWYSATGKFDKYIERHPDSQ